MTRLSAAPPAGRVSPTAQRAPGGLPFGAVMATGGAAQLAGLAGVEACRMPLLWLTLVVAGVVTGFGLLNRSLGPQRAPAVARIGQFTIPVGLAVIGIGFAEATGPAAFAAAVTAVAAAWVATLTLTVQVVLPVARSRPGLSAVTGVWFIVPAAFLADAAGTAALIRDPSAPLVVVAGWLAVIGCAVGVVSYLGALVLALVRVAALGLAGAPAAAWWIVTGCGGLAAAALGDVSRVAPSSGLSVVGAAALVCWVVATIVVVPVGVLSLRHLVGVRKLSTSPPWPPAFSTAVYALGTAQVGALFDLAWAPHLAQVVAVETLVVWAATGALRVAAMAERLHAVHARCP